MRPSNNRLGWKHRTLLALGVVVIWVATPGCALLGFNAEDGDSGLDMNDPIVRAAIQVRSGRTDSRPATRDPASYASSYASGYAPSASSAVQLARINREVVPGMNMSDVRAVLGEPLEVQTAGDEHEGNERWIYSDGYRGQLNHGPSRILYFESGKVAGWRNYDAR